jgi:acetylornithine deacetylase/succinyl-diaminopimelate desuccinylase-like protein
MEGSDGAPAGASGRWTEAFTDPDGFRLLRDLVRSAPTNLEDPVRGRYEKPRYPPTADLIARTARLFGLSARIFDPVAVGLGADELRGIPRPNVIVDLDRGAAHRVLLLAHYDVVPVPAEQLDRWRSPPHELTPRADGRLYGRGANDDLGSGVVASLLAMKQLARGDATPRANVRLLVCCDEETGGEGGIEALKRHDAALAADDPERFVAGDVALIPDGSPHATAGSSGVLFLDAGFDAPVPLNDTLAYGEFLVGLHDRVRAWRSRMASPDWPDHRAPEPVVTGRVTVTQFDWRVAPGPAGPATLLAAHAETDATNLIARTVTLLFRDPAGSIDGWRAKLAAHLAAPFRLEAAGSTALERSEGSVAIAVVGESQHAGYPHLAANPVPEAFRLLRGLIGSGQLAGGLAGTATFGIDLRLPPEMGLEEGRDAVLGLIGEWAVRASPHATIQAPASRARGGYALRLDHPALARLESLLGEEFGAHGVFAEYGGTDASSLAGLRTPSGEPLPALVFGSMDRAARIHDAEESVDPRLLGGVVRTIRRFVAGA